MGYKFVINWVGLLCCSPSSEIPLMQFKIMALLAGNKVVLIAKCMTNVNFFENAQN